MGNKKNTVRTWNYRLVASHTNNADVFKIHAVYYDKDGNPELISISEDTLAVDSVDGDLDAVRDELSTRLQRYKEALSKPVLSLENFPEEYKSDKNNNSEVKIELIKPDKPDKLDKLD